jgi:uncharacterized coiled-coil DUF342 family protein
VYYANLLRGKLLKDQQEANEIAEIDRRLVNLREQVGKINADTKVCLEKRDKLNAQFRTYRAQIHELQKERNSLNERVKKLKQQRDATRASNGSIIEEIKVRRSKIEELKKKKPRIARQRLEKEFQETEWTIQTTSLDLKEEKRLVEEVKQLEQQLSIYRRLEQQNKKIGELRNKLEAFEANANVFHEELVTTAQKSQDLHTNLIAKINESKKIKAEADTLHATYIQLRAKTKPLYEEIKGLSEQKKKFESTMREEDQGKRRLAEKNLKEALGSQARHKLQHGEKISWQEFQLLEGDDSQSSDTQD